MITFEVERRNQLLANITNANVPECDQGYVVTITPKSEVKKLKTDTQRNAFHLWCGLLAESLNDAGLDQRVVFDAMKEGVEIPWTKLTIKENLWKPVQAAAVKKAWTEQLAIDEHNQVYMVLHRWLSSKGWPCPEWPKRGARNE